MARPRPVADPLPALRLALRRDRDRGRPFAEAWPRACGRALAGLRPRERNRWRAALDATEGAWRRAYEGEPPAAEDVFVRELRALA